MPYTNKLGVRQQAMLDLIKNLEDHRWHRGCGRYSVAPREDERVCETLVERGCLEVFQETGISGHPPIFRIPEGSLS